jgi:hypothetical protein
MNKTIITNQTPLWRHTQYNTSTNTFIYFLGKIQEAN